MPRPTPLAHTAAAPVSAPPKPDCCYVLGHHGFVYAGRDVASHSTMRHAGVLLLSTNYAPFQIDVRGGRSVRAQAMVVAPLVERGLDARGVPLLSFNVMPSHGLFHIFSALQQPGVMVVDRHAFNPFDDDFVAMHRGDMPFAQAESVFDAVVADVASDLPPAPAPDPKALALIRMLDANPQLSLDDLAQQFGRSNQAMSRLFSSAVGMSLRDYQSWLKQRRMYDLLYTPRSLTAVAHEAGFSDSPQFTRAYQRWYGKSPSLTRDPRHVRVFIRNGHNGPRGQDAG